MTAEEQRDQWLKRVLPGLAVGVAYAAFIGPVVSGKADKAYSEYKALYEKGISAAALPGMKQQIDDLRTQIAGLKQNDEKIHAELSGLAGFLAQGSSANAVSKQLAASFAEHRLRVIEEKLDEKTSPDTFSKSLRDTQDLLKDALHLKDTLTVLEIHFAGTYADTYGAMAALANGKINALPISLSMRELQNTDRSARGMLEWRLKLWL
jgi:hypothetical protein